jgi:phospholipid/cholesterol/gamma-HCH transport system substrate-binding protein
VRRNQKRGLGYFGWGVIAIVLAVAITYFGFTKSVPFRHHYTVTAMFKQGANVKKGYAVRIAGVNVGKVTEVQAVEPGNPAARVTMRLDKKGLPLHTDATFKIRPRIFLEGNVFIDISPGTPSAPVVKDGHVFPIQQGAAMVQLDQIVTSLQSSTRQDLQKLLRELSSAFSRGGAEGYNRSIPYWKPAYKYGALVSDATLGTEEHDLSGYIASAGKVAQGLDTHPQQLQSLVADLNTTGRALAIPDQQLASAIAELPRTLAAGLPALKALNDAFPPVRRFVSAFRPAVRSSGPALDASVPFTQQLRHLVSEPELRGFVADLRPTVPDLARLNKTTIPLYDQVSLASNCQNDVILPWSKDKIQDAAFPAEGPVFEEAAKPLVGLAGESRSGDANGQWFSVLVQGAQFAYEATPGNFILTGTPLQGTNPPPPDPNKRAPLRPDVPCETQQQPDLRTVVGPVPPARRMTLDSPAAKERYAKAQAFAVDWLKHRIDAQGLQDQLKVDDTPLTESRLKSIVASKSLGRVGAFKVAKKKKASR